MAFEFDGTTNEEISLADNDVFDLPDGDWTISGWFKLNSTSYPGHDPALISQRQFSSTHNMAVRMYSYGGTLIDEVYFLSKDNDGTTLLADGAGASNWTADTNWHNVIVSRSGTTVTVYLDNSSIASKTEAAYDGVTPAADLMFGNRDPGSKPFNGHLAEWAKWDRALDSSERQALADAHAPTFFRDSIMWYMPMRRQYQEILHGITVTNDGSVVSNHPRMRYPSSPRYGFTDKSQQIVAPLLSVSPTLYAPTLSTGGVSLSPPLLGSTVTLYTPAFTAGGVSLGVPLLSAATTLYAPTFSPGGVTMQAPLLSASTTLYAPTLMQPQTIEAPFLSSTTTLYAPAFVFGQTSDFTLVSPGTDGFTKVTPGSTAFVRII